MKGCKNALKSQKKKLITDILIRKEGEMARTDSQSACFIKQPNVEF